MNDAAPEPGVGGGAETAKLVVAIVLVIAGIVAFYVLHAQPDWLRWLCGGGRRGARWRGVRAARRAAGGSGSSCVESRLELRKVVWPDRQETMR